MSHGNMQYLIIQNLTLEYSSYVSDMNLIATLITKIINFKHLVCQHQNVYFTL